MNENQDNPEYGKTMLRRMEQYRDRWSSYGATFGLVTLSDKLSVEQLREYELFAEYDDRFLEKISPDISIGFWNEGSILFEEGSYIDLAFFVLEGKIDVFVNEAQGPASVQFPKIDQKPGVVGTEEAALNPATDQIAYPSQTIVKKGSAKLAAESGDSKRIAVLASMDLDLTEGTVARLGLGEVVGEIGALSGWPQSVTARTATGCLLMQIRVPALRLMKRKSEGLSKRLDDLYRQRSLASQLKNTPLLRDCPPEVCDLFEESATLVSCAPDEVVVHEGGPADALFIVRSGFVKVSQTFGEGELVCTYISKGMTFGEVELLLEGVTKSEFTATSVEYSELIRIPRDVVEAAHLQYPKIEERLWRSATVQIQATGFSRSNFQHSEFTQIALESGLVQGTSILAIDLEQCTRCDDCVRACASTHGGRPRFVREGSKYKNLQIPKSCYHCRDPVCLVGCPTGAIHRAGIADVIEIDDPICIGCATCANNCPYDAIVMHDMQEVWPKDMVPIGLRGEPRKVASKCDLCSGSKTGPACVNACPQGCAFRVSTLDEFEELLVHRG